MTFTTLWANDNWPTSRATINANFVDAQSQLDTKVEFSGTAPAIGDMAVFDATDGLGVKKLVLTASQTVESDANGQLTTAAKGTAYNKNFGTGSTDVAAGDVVVRLTGDQTVAGVKTFSSAPIVPTQSANDNSTKAASTAYADAAVSAVAYTVDTLTFSRSLTTASWTQVINHNLGKTPKLIVFWTVGIGVDVTGTGVTVNCQGGYDGTTNNCVTNAAETGSNNNNTYCIMAESIITFWKGYQGSVTAWDSTTFTITWVKTGSPTGTFYTHATVTG